MGDSAGRVEVLLAGCFPEGLELGPAYALRGQLALERGKLSKALADAERAVTRCPNEVRGYLVRGRVRLERGTEGALTDLTRAAELSRRKDPQVLHWLAAALAQSGRWAEALLTQREAVKLKPQDRELLEQLRELEKKANPAPQPD
jgi:tetratricopeptide (TPR) repeat protein